MSSKSPVYLALQGGGVKGFAHLGAITRLEALLDPQGYSGTSIGSLVAALMAAGYTAQELHDEVLAWDLVRLIKKQRKPWRVSLRKPKAAAIASALDAQYDYKQLVATLDRLLGRKGMSTFGDLKRSHKPLLAIVACQLGGDDPLVIYRSDDDTYSQMKIAEAVEDSMAAPTYFAPKQTRGRVNIDGGIVSNLPLLPFRDLTGATGVPVVALEFAETHKSGGSLVELLAPLSTAVSTALNRYAMPGYTSVKISTNVGAFDFSVLGSKERVKALMADGAGSAELFLKNEHIPPVATPEQGGYYFRRKISQALNGLGSRLEACRDAHFQEVRRPPLREIYFLKYYAYRRLHSGSDRFEPVASCVNCEQLEAGHDRHPEQHMGLRYDARGAGNGGGIVWKAKDLLSENLALGRDLFHGMPFYFLIDCADAKNHLAPSIRSKLKSGGARSIATVPVCNVEQLLGVIQVCSNVAVPADPRDGRERFFGSPEFDETLKEESRRLSAEVVRWTAPTRW